MVLKSGQDEKSNDLPLSRLDNSFHVIFFFCKVIFAFIPQGVLSSFPFSILSSFPSRYVGFISLQYIVFIPPEVCCLHPPMVYCLHSFISQDVLSSFPKVTLSYSPRYIVLIPAAILSYFLHGMLSSFP